MLSCFSSIETACSPAMACEPWEDLEEGDLGLAAGDGATWSRVLHPVKSRGLTRLALKAQSSQLGNTVIPWSHGPTAMTFLETLLKVTEWFNFGLCFSNLRDSALRSASLS